MDYESFMKHMTEQVDEDSQRNFRTLTAGQRYLNTDGYNVEFLEMIPEKEYVLDIIPFWVTDEKCPDYQKLFKRYGKDEMFDYKLHLWVHRRLGPNRDTDIVCPKKTYNLPCPVCDEHQKFWDMEKVIDDPEEIKAVKDGKAATKPSLRVFMVVIDKMDGNKMKLLEYSNFWFFNNLITSSKRVMGDKQVCIPDFTDNGHSIRFFPDKSAFNKKDGTPAAGEIKSFEFIPRKVGEGYDVSIMDKAFPIDKMIVIKTTEEISNILNGNTGAQLDLPEPNVTYEPAITSPNDSAPSFPKVEQNAPNPFAASPVADAPDPATFTIPQPTTQPQAGFTPRAPQPPTNANTPACPHGHTFGKDSFMHDECQNCAISKRCWSEYQNNM